MVKNLLFIKRLHKKTEKTNAEKIFATLITEKDI